MNFEEKLKNDPYNPNLHREYGLWLLDENRVDEAVEIFSKGLVYNPFDSLMRFWRGRKYIGREMYTQSASGRLGMLVLSGSCLLFVRDV